MEAIQTNIEQELEQASALMVKRASAMTITNNDEYERGNGILKEIKCRIGQVKDYWREPKAAADRAHKALVEREKQMLKPLQDADGVVKRAMLAYTQEAQRKQREAEEAASQEREEEQKRLAALAAEAEQQGDSAGAAFMRDMIEAVEPVDIAPAAPASKGVSVRRTWKARVIDEKLVPAYFENLELRTINAAALNNIARDSEGKAQIPGVEMYLDETLVTRA